MKKIFKLKILIPLVALLLIVNVGITMLVGIMGAVTNNGRNDCGAVETTSSTSDSTVSSADGSIDGFVKKHKEAYILSWKAGGFLPSAEETVESLVEDVVSTAPQSCPPLLATAPIIPANMAIPTLIINSIATKGRIILGFNNFFIDTSPIYHNPNIVRKMP